jgi:predicted GIY-YIG superfamily endonuclease
MYYLYYLKSTLDDKFYIGVTNNPNRRYYEHINYTVKKNHYNGNWIKKTLTKGGEIKMGIALSNLSKEEAIELEIEMISLFKKLDPKNITNTADGGLGFNHKGIPQSEEHKKSLEKSQPHKVRIPKETLYDLYINQKLSKKKIGEIYGCGATTIDRRLIEYNIKPRTTPNYKISHKINKEEVLDMFLKKRMSILKISEHFNVGFSGIRYLLQREGVDTSLNKNKLKFDKDELKNRYLNLINKNINKMEIYEILSEEFNLSSSYISKLLTSGLI